VKRTFQDLQTQQAIRTSLPVWRHQLQNVKYVSGLQLAARGMCVCAPQRESISRHECPLQMQRIFFTGKAHILSVFAATLLVVKCQLPSDDLDIV
jgi:hypothetical protein